MSPSEWRHGHFTRQTHNFINFDTSNYRGSLSNNRELYVNRPEKSWNWKLKMRWKWTYSVFQQVLILFDETPQITLRQKVWDDEGAVRSAGRIIREIREILRHFVRKPERAVH